MAGEENPNLHGRPQLFNASHKERVMANDGKKCKHNLCDCAAAEDSDYCSEYCENASDTGITEIACSCGHPGCS
jgi:hypothetical protein